jgi:Domain of unknown function (DUF4416)
MGRISEPKDVRLFAGFMYREKEVLELAKQDLVDQFGRVILRSPVFDFDFTDYYTPEMGAGLKKSFIAFENLINPASLAEIKVFTNNLESRLSTIPDTRQKRKINIDPGYITQSKVVLTSTKNRSQRVYIGKGIYAEVTLIFKSKRWEPLPWTYPDFRTPAAQEFLTRLREQL